MVLLGKRKITQNFIDIFVKIENFEPEEAKYFDLLVKYSQAKTHHDRDVFGASLIKLIKNNTNQEDISDHVDFVSKPLHPRLLVLLSFEDIQRNVQTLARLTDSAEITIIEALNVLKSLGLIEKTSENSDQWRATKTMFRVPDNIGSVTLAQFHEKSLQDALKAFALPREERHFKSFLLPMDSNELAIFHKILSDFSAEIIARFHSDSYKDRRVYQVNFNIFPISKSIQSSNQINL